MRIALLVPGGVDRGGERRVIPAILWLIERLARNHDVQVIVPRQEPEPATWPLLGATVHNIGKLPGRPAALRATLRLHRQKPFDLFHAIRARWPAEVAFVAARLCRRPMIVHVAGGELVWLPDIRFGSGKPAARAVTRFILRHADRVTAVSHPMLELVRRAGADPLCVPFGVDTTVWQPEPPRPCDQSRPARIVHIGNLTPVKDHGTLLRAVAQLIRNGRRVDVDLIGEDTSSGSVPRMAEQLGIAEHVTFHGFLPQRQAVPVVRNADLMAVTSRHEGGPLAMLEAAALGVPTVGTCVGLVHDWAPDAAVAVPVGDAVSLALAIDALLSDDARRLSIAQRAQQRALRQDADWTCARFEQLYAELVR